MCRREMSVVAANSFWMGDVPNEVFPCGLVIEPDGKTRLVTSSKEASATPILTGRTIAFHITCWTILGCTAVIASQPLKWTALSGHKCNKVPFKATPSWAQAAGPSSPSC